MRDSLLRWISDADQSRHQQVLDAAVPTLDDEAIRARSDDLFIGLVSELFAILRSANRSAADLSRVANALIDLVATRDDLGHRHATINAIEARLYAAASFYLGGFPASAYLSLRNVTRVDDARWQPCVDLLARRRDPSSVQVAELLRALLAGNLTAIRETADVAEARATQALADGPDGWIPARLFEALARRFAQSNVRSVVPDGTNPLWNPLVESFLQRSAPVWEFFPSQIDAIRRGLLTRNESYALQMPTGAGKTALCETLLFWHASTVAGSVAVLLVPYRSLAAELRRSLVRRLSEMGIPTACFYGGSVPTSEEAHAAETLRVIVATPETLSGILGANQELSQRIALIICDEGHLLDGDSRGVSLELLLARLRSRNVRPRVIFVSAIVPNIDEINAWLGGNSDTVVRSNYQAAVAEFGVLRPQGRGAEMAIGLQMHPHLAEPTRFLLPSFLPAAVFRYRDPRTGRARTYPHISVKTQAIAAARKALALGSVAIFAANKRGNQGAIGITEEVLQQLGLPLALPRPERFANVEDLDRTRDFLERECGSDWIGTRAIANGVVLHHGDIPQEMREVLEDLLRLGSVRMVVCTKTLAEGVNLPIRTLMLYSVRMIGTEGRPQDLLTRDMKNLVGRAGRAGANTKGMVICANPEQWSLVARVAGQATGENVQGALIKLVRALGRALAKQGTSLTNEFLEARPGLLTLVDGIDDMLVDLAVEEVGEAELIRLAEQVASETFAARVGDAVSTELLRQVFALRARRVAGLVGRGRLNWVRRTGSHPRLVNVVETTLLPAIGDWSVSAPEASNAMEEAVLSWAWRQPEVRSAVRRMFEVPTDASLESYREAVLTATKRWLNGETYTQMAAAVGLPVDELLRLHASVIGYALQTVVEQGIALLEVALAEQGVLLHPALREFPTRLRFGIPSSAGRGLAQAGVRHRRAAIELGQAIQAQALQEPEADVRALAAFALTTNRPLWESALGQLVVSNTALDLAAFIV